MISDNLNNIKIYNTLIQLYSTTGIVASTNTRSETEVTGSGGGGVPNVHPGSGQSSPVHFKIESNTTRYQELFLIDEENKEHAFNFVDFMVPCRKGNLLTVIWGIKRGKDLGPYFAAYNHDTQEISYDNDILGQYCRPRFLPLILYPTLIILGISLCVYIANLITGGITGAVAVIIPAVFVLLGVFVGIKAGWRLSKIILDRATNKKITEFIMSDNWQSVINDFKQILKEKHKVSE